MYFDSTVKIPDEKGKIIRKKKGNTTYVLYQYGRVYNAEKKYAVPQRAIIGKVDPNSPDTMYPNERFQEFFPTVTLLEELPELLCEGDTVLIKASHFMHFEKVVHALQK